MQAAKKFAGKVALVTGGTDGLGLATALHLGRLGASVAVGGRSQDKLTQATKRLDNDAIPHLGMLGHIGDSEVRKAFVQQTVDKFGGIDFFIQSAAVNPRNGKFTEVDESKFDHIMNVNVKASFALTKLVYPTMKARGGGAIIYFSSTAGNNPGKFSTSTLYSFSKSSLNQLAMFLSPELGEANITINSLALGAFRTGFSNFLFEDPSFAGQLRSIQCLDRIGTFSHVSSMVEYLCSEEGNYTTGALINIDGGTRVSGV